MLWEHFWKIRWSQVWHLRSLKCLSAVANADYQIVIWLDFLQMKPLCICLETQTETCSSTDLKKTMRMFQGSNGLNKASEATFVGMTGSNISPLQSAFYYIKSHGNSHEVTSWRARQKTYGACGIWNDKNQLVFGSCNSKSQKTKDGVSFGSVWSWEWRVPTRFCLKTVRKDWLVKPLEAKVLKLVAFLDFSMISRFPRYLQVK